MADDRFPGWHGTTKYLFGRIEVTYGMGLMLGMYLVAWFVLKRTTWGEDVREIAGQGRVVRVRGEYLPLIALHELFGIDARCTEPSQGILVILESDGARAALLLDELVGQQQVVVKNLESNYRKVPGISGATILGDGGVSLILDVAMMLRGYGRKATASVL